ncbi:hypothetical protein [Hyphomicrobium sp. NDB2Meth4]|uniref:hypothetical protein n=1 Tax=Hyphomicrobium sp. NDB2Meth4 TaxID=1892846 RepID=UPI000AA00CDB|nr:hypothetical protein [Hyphomicrobium sp. NDB2Meth4]
MQVYVFRREREVALTLHRDGGNLPGGVVWERNCVIAAAGLRDDIVEVIESVGFFVWA